MSTYKALTRPILEYVSTIWSPLASNTNINKLQITQNTALSQLHQNKHSSQGHGFVYGFRGSGESTGEWRGSSGLDAD